MDRRRRNLRHNRKIGAIAGGRAGKEPEKDFAATVADLKVAAVEPQIAAMLPPHDLHPAPLDAKTHGARVVVTVFAALVRDRNADSRSAIWSGLAGGEGLGWAVVHRLGFSAHYRRTGPLLSPHFGGKSAHFFSPLQARRARRAAGRPQPGETSG